MIVLSRTGGMRPPQFRELLEIDTDGTFARWRSVSMASALPSPIGRFAGSLEAPELTGLTEAAAGAVGAGSRSWLISPDSPVDRLEVDGSTATLGIHEGGEGPWKVLVDLVRPLLGELTYAARAAIAVDVEVDGGATLVHRGTDRLRLDLSRLAVRAFHWRDGQSEGAWTADAVDRGEVDAGPEWTLELPFDHGFDVKAGDRVTASVSFAAHDGERFIPVGLQSA